MTDPLSKTQRSEIMSKVRSADTKPEWILRCGLHRLGFRYRLKNKGLPGCPDLSFSKYTAVVFVHGCYWHRHPGCKDASTPKTNVTFWTRKFAENVERDQRAQAELERLGWRVLVVWECDLTKHTAGTIRRVASWLMESGHCVGGLSYSDSLVDRESLLAVAEKKVRYRIASYNYSSRINDSGASEAEEPRK